MFGPTKLRRTRGGIPLGWRRDLANGEIVPDEDEREARTIALEERERDPTKPLALIAEVLEEKRIRTRSGKTWSRSQVKRLLNADPDAYLQHSTPADVVLMATIRSTLRVHGTLRIESLRTWTALEHPFVTAARIYELVETLKARGKVEMDGEGLGAEVRLLKS